MGSRSLLQGIFPAKGSNLGLPHCKWILYQLSHLKNPPAVWEIWVWSLGWEDPLENGTATHSNILSHLKNRKLCNFFGKHSSGFKWLNIELPSDLTIPLLGKRNENICPNNNLYTNICSSIIHNSNKVEITQKTSTGEWINKMWYIYTMKYYLATKKNEIKICATMWMNHENITLNEISHTWITTYYMIPLIKLSIIGIAMEAESRPAFV